MLTRGRHGNVNSIAIWRGGYGFCALLCRGTGRLLIRRDLRRDSIAYHPTEKVTCKPSRRIIGSHHPHGAGCCARQQSHGTALGLGQIRDLPNLRIDQVAHFLCGVGQHAVDEAVFKLAAHDLLNGTLNGGPARGLDQFAHGTAGASQVFSRARNLHHASGQTPSQRRCEHAFEIDMAGGNVLAQ